MLLKFFDKKKCIKKRNSCNWELFIKHLFIIIKHLLLYIRVNSSTYGLNILINYSNSRDSPVTLRCYGVVSPFSYSIHSFSIRSFDDRWSMIHYTCNRLEITINNYHHSLTHSRYLKFNDRAILFFDTPGVHLIIIKKKSVDKLAIVSPAITLHYLCDILSIDHSQRTSRSIKIARYFSVILLLPITFPSHIHACTFVPRYPFIFFFPRHTRNLRTHDCRFHGWRTRHFNIRDAHVIVTFGNARSRNVNNSRSNRRVIRRGERFEEANRDSRIDRVEICRLGDRINLDVSAIITSVPIRHTPENQLTTCLATVARWREVRATTRSCSPSPPFFRGQTVWRAVCTLTRVIVSRETLVVKKTVFILRCV